MLKRRALLQMGKWKANLSDKTALFVTGARQVGKTYLIREFAGTHYDNLAEVNLYENSQAAAALGTAESSAELFLRLSAFVEGELVPGKTLVFIDEVQECPNVITKIKFLLERRDFDFVMSGSLLGVELKSVKSLPIGSLTNLNMYPLDFEEFCWAKGISADILADIKHAFTSLRPVDDYIHKIMLNAYHEYLFVGGMPAAVSAFVNTNDIQAVRSCQGNIYDWYREDIAKYAGTRSLVIKKIFDTMPSELNNQNKRFKLASIDDKARLSRYENDFLWLVDSNVAIPAYNSTEPRAPLAASANGSLFKLYLNDVGLLTYAYGINAVRDMAAGRTDIKFGALYENAVAQELFSRRNKPHDPLYFYKNAKIGEVDFLTTDAADRIVPIEVKSGKTYKRHAALTNLLSVKNYSINQAYVLCEQNITNKGSIIYLPIYMSMFMN